MPADLSKALGRESEAQIGLGSQNAFFELTGPQWAGGEHLWTEQRERMGWGQDWTL